MIYSVLLGKKTPFLYLLFGKENKMMESQQVLLVDRAFNGFRYLFIIHFACLLLKRNNYRCLESHRCSSSG